MDQHSLSALRQAGFLLKAGEIQAAQMLLVDHLQSYPDFEQGWYLLSYTYKNPNQIIIALRRALEINPDFREARERLDNVEERAVLSKKESAGTGDSPDRKETVELTAHISIAAETGDSKHSVPELSSFKPLYQEVETLIAGADLVAAHELLRDFLKTHPNEPEGWYLLSLCEPTQRGQVRFLEQALRIKPGYPQAKARMVELHPITLPQQTEPTAKPRTKTEKLASKPVKLGSKIHPLQKPKITPGTFSGLTRYTLKRGLMILATIVIGIYLTVLIINKDGQIDLDVQRQIDRQIIRLRYSNEFGDLTREEKQARLDEIQWEMEEEIGLHLPPILKNLRWTYNALVFQWGKVMYLGNMNLRLGPASETDDVKTLIRQYLPNTLMLFGAANLLVILVGIPLALFLASRGKNSALDRFISMLSPLSSVPSWVHGILLVTIFAVVLGVLPYGGKYDNIPPENPLGYIPIVAKHMVLPVMAIFLSMIFQLIYSWRTYFLIYADEDYVELAQAKGLSPKMLERRYILRPTMPYIITGFALTLVGFWQMSTALEAFFNWPGIGLLYVTALPNFWGEMFFPGEVSIILSVVVLFAFLLGFVVFILDATYAILDPRVRLGHTMDGDIRIKSRSAGRSVRFWKRGLDKRSNPPPGPIPKKISQPIHQRIKLFKVNLVLTIKQIGSWFNNLFREIRKYPSAMIGLALITILVGVSLYTVIALPYLEIGSEWRGSNISGRPYLPKNVPPEWSNWFRTDDMPTTVVLGHEQGDQNKVESGTESKGLSKTMETSTSGFKEFHFRGSLEYDYTTFPQGLYLYIDTLYQEKRPHISITWITPDGREFSPKSPTSETGEIYDFSKNLYTRRAVRSSENWRDWFVTEGQNQTPAFYLLFADPAADTPQALPGTYQIKITAKTFEDDSDVDLEVVMFGGIHGLAGTDYLRRDLTVPLLWGLPFTLAFGVSGAIVTTILAMIVAAAGVWFGGWLDGGIQRITEANMILPILAVGILIFAFYGVSLWFIMGVIILLNVFGSPTKSFRAAFFQVREAPYIEAARAYGASNTRIIFKYMIPKIVPVLIPQLVMLIPALVFLEATLGIFNVYDPRYPTWGRVIYEAITRAALWGGSAYWYLEPIALLLLVGVAFALLGFALERILNPRLQDA